MSLHQRRDSKNAKMLVMIFTTMAFYIIIVQRIFQASDPTLAENLESIQATSKVPKQAADVKLQLNDKIERQLLQKDVANMKNLANLKISVEHSNITHTLKKYEALPSCDEMFKTTYLQLNQPEEDLKFKIDYSYENATESEVDQYLKELGVSETGCYFPETKGICKWGRGSNF